MGRPLIGITAHCEQAQWRAWDADAVLLPLRYVTAVAQAGGTPVLLPPEQAVAEDAPDVLDRLDALVLAGGPDIGAATYGATPDPEAEPPRTQRDETELALLRAALDAGVPVLGICRGMQLMAVAAGGSLHQHLPRVLGNSDHAPARGVYGEHEVTLEASSILGRLLGTRVHVNSYHHQGVADPGRLVVAGRSSDGTVEALEDPQHAFVVGVQWHPEQAFDPRLFEALVAAAQEPVPQPPSAGRSRLVDATRPGTIDLRSR